MSARREITAVVAERYRAAGRLEKGRIFDELCAITGWHRKHGVRVLAIRATAKPGPLRQRHLSYGPVIKDALVALWEASDRLQQRAVQTRGFDEDFLLFPVRHVLFQKHLEKNFAIKDGKDRVSPTPKADTTTRRRAPLLLIASITLRVPTSHISAGVVRAAPNSIATGFCEIPRLTTMASEPFTAASTSPKFIASPAKAVMPELSSSGPVRRAAPHPPAAWPRRIPSPRHRNLQSPLRHYA